MNRLFYPAVFHRAEEGGFWVTFPDIPECMTQGDDMHEAYEMAVDALGLSRQFDSLTVLNNLKSLYWLYFFVKIEIYTCTFQYIPL